MTYDQSMTLYPQSNFRQPPARDAFEDQDEFEEALGYWQSHVGRSMGMYHAARMGQASEDNSIAKPNT